MTSENAARLTANLDSTNTADPEARSPRRRTGTERSASCSAILLLYNDTRRLLRQLDSLIADIKANPKKYINLRIF